MSNNRIIDNTAAEHDITSQPAAKKAKRSSALDSSVEFSQTATNKSMECIDLLQKAIRISKSLSAIKNETDCEDSDDDDDEDDITAPRTDDMTVLSQDRDNGIQLLNDLVNVMDDISGISKTYDSVLVPNSSSNNNNNLQKKTTEEFQSLYTQRFTSVFGAELNAFRDDPEFTSKDINFLVDCIHAGAEVYTPLEKQMFN